MHGKFDLVFSRMVNEHISDGRAYHTNIHNLLEPNGLAAHCFSTLYALPFTANRILPDWIGGMLLNLFAPRDAHKTGKFRAYYSWSRGPSAAVLSRFEALGYEVIEYRGYFGHTYYRRVPLLHRLEGLKSRVLLATLISPLCSYGMMIARKRCPAREVVRCGTWVRSAFTFSMNAACSFSSSFGGGVVRVATGTPNLHEEFLLSRRRADTEHAYRPGGIVGEAVSISSSCCNVQICFLRPTAFPNLGRFL